MAAPGNASREALSEAARVLSAARELVLLAHVNPDADALGSALALGMALRDGGASVSVSFGSPDRLPSSLQDLDSEGLFVPAGRLPETSTLVVLDTGAEQRLGPLSERIGSTVDRGGDVVVVDHHLGNTRYGTHHVIDEDAEATAVLVLQLLDELGVELDQRLARCLYAGLATDTRSFRSARPSTHRTAARLLEAGVDPAATIKPLLDTHPFAWLRVLSGVLQNAELEESAVGGLGFAHATVTLEQSRGVRGEELDSVVDLLRTAAEAEVTAVLKEVAPGTWSVSLRAESGVDVSWAARACGGGGHRLAAGFTRRAPASQVLASLRSALDQAPRI